MSLNRDQLQSLIETHYDKEAVGGPDAKASDLAFHHLIEVADHVYRLYLEESAPDIERPETFEPQTLTGVSEGFALIAGLMDHLEMRHHDGDFGSLAP